MKPVNWSTEKNILAEQGVSFEEVLSAMSNGSLLAVLDHPNTDQYPNQRMFVVRIRGYAYLVPFVETTTMPRSTTPRARDFVATPRHWFSGSLLRCAADAE